MSIWLLNSGINDGYPYINDTPVEIPPIMKSPYPNIMGIWLLYSDINDGYPFINNTVEIPPIMKSPYPDTIMILNSGINDGYPFINDSEINSIILGSFMYSQLNTVSIPRSCQKIGSLAFNQTNVSNVKISSTCDYSSTSFPDNCNIEVYED